MIKLFFRPFQIGRGASIKGMHQEEGAFEGGGPVLEGGLKMQNIRYSNFLP